MAKKSVLASFAAAATALYSCSCSDMAMSTIGDAGSSYGCYATNDCPAGLYCNEFYRCVRPSGSSDGGPSGGFVAPETEPIIGKPQGGLHHVYVAMTALDSVARIDSETLEVASIAVGDAPSSLAAVAGQDLAVVLNSGSDSATILRIVDGLDQVVTVPTLRDLNALSIAPSGAVAVAYFRIESSGTPSVGSLQDVSLIHLRAGQEHVNNVSVGFRPRGVTFSADWTRAFVVTEDGVSTVDLDAAAGDFVARAVPLSSDPLAEGPPAEVLVSPDGRLAFARWDGLAAVRTVQLASGAMVDTPLASAPSDFDLTSDGSRLVAVLRSTAQLARLTVRGNSNILDVEVLDCSPIDVGQVAISPDDRYALVFTNTTNQKALVRADLQAWDVAVAPLRKAVRAVVYTPDSRTAIVLHNKVPGDPSTASDLAEAMDRRYGFSLVDLGTLFVKLQLTDASPGALTFLPDSTAAYVLLADAATSTRQVGAINLASYIVTTLNLGSVPTDIGGVVGTGRVFVLQDHPMGRISFVQASTGEVRTVTGFQLNSQITE